LKASVFFKGYDDILLISEPFEVVFLSFQFFFPVFFGFGGTVRLLFCFRAWKTFLGVLVVLLEVVLLLVACLLVVLLRGRVLGLIASFLSFESKVLKSFLVKTTGIESVAFFSLNKSCFFALISWSSACLRRKSMSLREI
jgi:hypothetical protein